MANANLVELNQALKECIEYCDKATHTPYIHEHCRPLAQAKQQLDHALATTDRYFVKWSNELGEDKLVGKHLARELAQTQRLLQRVNAIGFPTAKVMYWDEELLEAAVKNMTAYLNTRREHLPFAQEQIEKLERGLERLKGQDIEADGALKDYQRYVQLRADAITNASNVLAGFRIVMRRELGREHQDYKNIRWPFSVAPDEYVL